MAETKEDKQPAIIFKPNDAEEKRLNESYTRFIDARDSREVVDRNWEAFEKQWEGYFGDELEDQDRSSTGEYRSNVCVPMTFWLVMTAMTEYIQSNPSLVLLPQSDEDIPFREIQQEIVNYSL